MALEQRMGVDLGRRIRLEDGIVWAAANDIRIIDIQLHLKPGDGDMDFANMFRRIEAKGFSGHYVNGYGSLDDMLAGKRTLLAIARSAGIE